MSDAILLQSVEGLGQSRGQLEARLGNVNYALDRLIEGGSLAKLGELCARVELPKQSFRTFPGHNLQAQRLLWRFQTSSSEDLQ